MLYIRTYKGVALEKSKLDRPLGRKQSTRLLMNIKYYKGWSFLVIGFGLKTRLVALIYSKDCYRTVLIK